MEIQPTNEEYQITLKDKITNMIGGTIPHLEAILNEKIDENKYKIIFFKNLDQLAELKKELAIILILLEDRDWKDVSDRELKTLAVQLKISVEIIKRGINKKMLEIILDFIDESIFSNAFKKLAHYKSKMSLYKRLMVLWRKVQTLKMMLPAALSIELDDICTLPRSSPEWKELLEVGSEITLTNQETMEILFKDINSFLFAVQVAHAKTTNSLLNIKKMSEEEIKDHMTPNFHDYEEYMGKKSREGYKDIWKKKDVPKLTSKLWKLFFSYTINKDDCFDDLELFIAFPNKKCVKEFWNMSETYAANASRMMKLPNIKFSRNVYIHTDVLKDVIKPTRQDSLTCFHTINTKWSFLGKTPEIVLTDNDFMPRDLFWDHKLEARIGIRIISHVNFPFESLMKEYREEKGIPPFKQNVNKKDKEEDENSKKKKGIIRTMFHKMAKVAGIIDDKEEEEEKEEEDDQSHYVDFDLGTITASKEEITKVSSPILEDDPIKLEIVSPSLKMNKPEEITHMSQLDNNQEMLETPSELGTVDFRRRKTTSVKSSNLDDSLMKKKKVGDNISDSGMREKSQEKPKSSSPPKSKKMKMKKSAKELFKKIIIHFHGGGFMAMSSYYHETYLRRFAKAVKRPFFSVDYRLAPAVQYPENIHDCIKAYFWIMKFIKEVIKTEVEDVIIFGDSAGGNLATCLTYWLIENQQRVPDMLLCCYGSFSLDKDKPTPSHLISFEDYILNYSAMLAVCQQYIPKEAKPDKDYYASPVLAPASLLKKMPKVRFFTCLRDPLCDDQIRLAYKMKKAGVDIWISMFKYFEHGVLNLEPKDLPFKIYQDLVKNEMINFFKERDLSRIDETEDIVSEKIKDSPPATSTEKLVVIEKGKNLISPIAASLNIKNKRPIVNSN